MNRYSPDAASLRASLTMNGIKEPLFEGFQWSTKMGGEHYREVEVGGAKYVLRIWAEGPGYAWSFGRA